MKIIRPDFNNSIMNVSNSILHNYGIETSYPGIKELDKELEKGYNHILYILLDGLGTNIIHKHLTKKQAFNKYLKKEITSVFPPTTVAATNAVLSAVPPITSGYLGWVQYFEQEDTDLTVFLNKDFYTDKPFDEMLRHKYLSYPNILDQVKNKNNNVQTTILFPDFIENGVIKDFKDGIEKALMITHNTDQSFTYLYWTQPDLIEHKAGIYSKEVKDMVQSLNDDFEELVENINDDTLVILIADHGLTDVEEINLFEYDTIMNMLKRKPSIEPRAINFFVKEEYMNSFKDEFNKLFQDKYMLLTKDEVFEAQLFGEGKKHPLIDMFIGDYMALATDKYMFSVNNEKTYKAHHAGLSRDEVMVPLIMVTKK